MEKSLCFGYTRYNKHEYNIYANNYKMSEIACIYISDYLNNIDTIYKHHTEMMNYFITKVENNDNIQNKIKLFPNFTNYNNCLMSTIPILFNNNISIETFTRHKIEAKKYYYPLNNNNNNENSKRLFDKIICLPLNMDTTHDIIDMYINILINT